MGIFNYSYERREKPAKKTNAFGLTSGQSWLIGLGLLVWIVGATLVNAVVFVVMIPFRIIGMFFALLTAGGLIGAIALIAIIGILVHAVMT